MRKGPRPEKVEWVAKMAEALKGCTATFFTSFHGLSTPELNNIRNELKKTGAYFHVIKNNLAKRAFVEAGYDINEDMFRGDNALAISYSDPVEVAKILKKHAEQLEKFLIKGGYLGKEFITPDQIKKLAELPPKPQLVAKLLGTLNAPIQGLVNVLNGVPRNLVYALNAIKEKKEKEG
ncbi:MAG: 50S ribosomal protein L10 [Synergistetes bacterium]|nr:MAG: 50S ribosomal protein L10 [bacterium 42_11]MBC7331784.1 50S ribosomal protein L10 [Synergistota bacterium]MDK2872210.1 large subunit ribosomal protein [bacterium]